TDYKNSGHSADQPGVRDIEDTVAQNYSSIEDVPDTTNSTPAHTSYWVLRYRPEDMRNTGQIHIWGRKSNTGFHSKTNHLCKRSRAYYSPPTVPQPQAGPGVDKSPERKKIRTSRRSRLQSTKLPAPKKQLTFSWVPPQVVFFLPNDLWRGYKPEA